MIENNVIINFTSGLNTREIAQILLEILSVMGLSVLNKAVAEAANGNYTVALLKNDCSTKWFH